MDDIWFSNIEIDDYLSNPEHTIAHLDDVDQADVLATLGEQLRTDDIVDDSFREAMAYELEDFYDDTLPVDEFDHLSYNSDEISDLCDIVEAVEKGHIIYG